MSDAYDDYARLAEQYKMEQEEHLEKMQSDKWITEDGTVIPVKLLKDAHILNIIRMFPEAEAVREEGERRLIA